MKSDSTKKIGDMSFQILVMIFVSGCVFYLLSFDYRSIARFQDEDEEGVVVSQIPVLWPPQSIFIKVEKQEVLASIEEGGYVGPDSDGDGMPDIWEKRFGLDFKKAEKDKDSDGDGLSDLQEYIFGTNPLRSDTDGDGFDDFTEIAGGYDPLSAEQNARLEAKLEISKIGVRAPVVWAKNENEDDIMEDLKKGVSHYYQSAAPGFQGNMIVTGHSSNYPWEKGDFNYIFRQLYELELQDGIDIHVEHSNGSKSTYTYAVKRRYVTAADDQSIFEETETPTLTLITCWPLGTDYRRMIVKAELVGIF